MRVARRAAKGAAALTLHFSGAREALSALERRAAGGRRVLILSYHRVVSDFGEEAKRSLPTLNIDRRTFGLHLEALQASHDVVSLEDALSVLDGSRQPARDVAVITFDDGYRDVYTHAFPLLRERRLPAVVYVPSSFAGSDGQLGHDRLYAALRAMDERAIAPMAVGVGEKFERWLIDVLDGDADPPTALERLIARYPSPRLLDLASALEERLGLSGVPSAEGQRALSWEMLREMQSRGVITGAHTAEHTVLTHQRLEEARREIAQCKAALEKNLRMPVRHFAWCNGFYSAGLARALKSEGFVSAVTTEDLPNLPGGDRFALKRKVLWQGSSAGILGLHSPALLACQLGDTFGMLGVQRAVSGARPTNFTPERALEPAESAEAAR
jgi:peptidoglycan/xylan/chitin deacetylase (PgdA/CDA1 family)